MIAFARRSLMLAVLIVLAGGVHGQERPAASIHGTVPRGVSRTIEITQSACALRARAHDPRTSPLLLTVEPGNEAGRWLLHVVGIIPGTHDVSGYLECSDGQRPAIDPIMVQVISTLPPGRHTTLAGSERQTMTTHQRPRFPAGAALGVWLLISIWWAARHIRRRVREASIPEPASPPTDPHRLLIEAIGTRPMTIPERGRLELLTLRALGSRHLTECPDSPLDLYRLLRRDPEASPVIEALEAWLHRPAPGERETGRLREMLRERFPATGCAAQGGAA